jgi:hypothetical protein
MQSATLSDFARRAAQSHRPFPGDVQPNRGHERFATAQRAGRGSWAVSPYKEFRLGIPADR